MWGGRYPIVWGGELIESKKRERETGHRPWWPPLTMQQSNNRIDGVSGGGAMEERSDLGETCGMTPCHHSSRRIDRQIIKKKNMTRPETAAKQC